MKVLIGLPRYLTWPLVMISVVGGVLLTHPDGIASAIEDVRHSRMWDDQVQTCQDRDVELQGTLEVILDRNGQKEYLSTQWVHGRIDFRLVVSQFEALNRGSESIARAVRTVFGKQVRDEEVTALNALLFLDAHTRKLSSADHYCERLRTEYISMFGHPPPSVK